MLAIAPHPQRHQQRQHQAAHGERPAPLHDRLVPGGAKLLFDLIKNVGHVFS
jgi:hypothetical protein